MFAAASHMFLRKSKFSVTLTMMGGTTHSTKMGRTNVTENKVMFHKCLTNSSKTLTQYLRQATFNPIILTTTAFPDRMELELVVATFGQKVFANCFVKTESTFLGNLVF